MPADSITVSLNRHPVSSNRHSGASRNLGRKEPLPPAPAKFPISQSNLPESLLHPKSGHTSALPLAPNPGWALRPAPAIAVVTRPYPTPPHSRVYCTSEMPEPVRMPATRPIRLAIQNPPKMMTPAYLTLLNLSAILFPIR